MKIEGARKLVMCGVFLLVGVGADTFGKSGLSTNLLSLIQFLSGAFVLGNGVEHVTGMLTTRAALNSAPSEEAQEETPELADTGLEALTAQVSALQADSTDIKAGMTNVVQTLAAIIQKLWPKQ